MSTRGSVIFLAVFFGFTVCGYCTVVSEVNWHPGMDPPSWSWIIHPEDSTADDIINFSGPSDWASNSCFATLLYGYPNITIDQSNHTVELWFEPPPPGGYCIDVWLPVCGLEGRFGPLEEGEWLFFNEGDFGFYIDFHVSAPPIIEVEYPNGGESFVAGSNQIIRWRDLRFEGFCPSTYEVEYSIDNGRGWISHMTVAGRCAAGWTVPDVNFDECLFRVYDISEPDTGDQSDQTFTIYQCIETSAADYNFDCYVNGYDYAGFAWWWGFELADMNDLADLADSWLLCSNPYDPECLD